jgi:lysyl-tRNA synthetase class 2
MTPRSDDWRPSAGIEVLKMRAEILRAIRHFFEERGVMEVDTPILGRHGVTDPAIENIAVPMGGAPWFLQSSPEYAMKRLLAAGSGPIYQLTRAFRGGEQGALHNVEFTMLEWYRPHWAMDALMDEVEALAQTCVGLRDIERLTHSELLRRAFGVDVFSSDVPGLRSLAQSELPQLSESITHDAEAILDLLYDEALARLRPTAFVHDFPASRAALAQVLQRGDVWIALRFELVVQGVELANGYQELTDPEEQARRFECDVATREKRGQPSIDIDDRLLAAMRHGLPACSGVALGVDRLLMQKLGSRSLSEVMAFPDTRA